MQDRFPAVVQDRILGGFDLISKGQIEWTAFLESSVRFTLKEQRLAMICKGRDPKDHISGFGERRRLR